MSKKCLILHEQTSKMVFIPPKTSTPLFPTHTNKTKKNNQTIWHPRILGQVSLTGASGQVQWNTRSEGLKSWWGESKDGIPFLICYGYMGKIHLSTLPKTHGNGKSPVLVGDKSSNGWFSIVMLVCGGVIALINDPMLYKVPSDQWIRPDFVEFNSFLSFFFPESISCFSSYH